MKHRITLTKDEAQIILRQALMINNPELTTLLRDFEIVDIVVGKDDSEWMDIYLEMPEE